VLKYFRQFTTNTRHFSRKLDDATHGRTTNYTLRRSTQPTNLQRHQITCFLGRISRSFSVVKTYTQSSSQLGS